MSEKLAKLEKKGGGGSGATRTFYFGGRTLYGASAGIGALIPKCAVKIDDIKDYKKAKIKEEYVPSGVSTDSVRVNAVDGFTTQMGGTVISLNTDVDISTYLNSGKTYLEFYVTVSNTAQTVPYMYSVTFSK